MSHTMGVGGWGGEMFPSLNGKPDSDGGPFHILDRVSKIKLQTECGEYPVKEHSRQYFNRLHTQKCKLLLYLKVSKQNMKKTSVLNCWKLNTGNHNFSMINMPPQIQG